MHTATLHPAHLVDTSDSYWMYCLNHSPNTALHTLHIEHSILHSARIVQHIVWFTTNKFPAVFITIRHLRSMVVQICLKSPTFKLSATIPWTRHCILHTDHCILHTDHCILHIAHIVQQIVWFTTNTFPAIFITIRHLRSMVVQICSKSPTFRLSVASFAMHTAPSIYCNQIVIGFTI